MQRLFTTENKEISGRLLDIVACMASYHVYMAAVVIILVIIKCLCSRYKSTGRGKWGLRMCVCVCVCVLRRRS